MSNKSVKVSAATQAKMKEEMEGILNQAQQDCSNLIETRTAKMYSRDFLLSPPHWMLIENSVRPTGTTSSQDWDWTIRRIIKARSILTTSLIGSLINVKRTRLWLQTSMSISCRVKLRLIVSSGMRNRNVRCSSEPISGSEATH